MAEYRLHWLLAAVACLILAGCILAGVLAVVVYAPQNKCWDEITRRIGKFESKEAGVRAAIPKLAAEIVRCPDAKVYRIMWTGPGDYQGNYRHAVLYQRINKQIGYEDDFLSGFSDKPYIVDDMAIRAVAEKAGTLEDFAEHAQDRK